MRVLRPTQSKAKEESKENKQTEGGDGAEKTLDFADTNTVNEVTRVLYNILREIILYREIFRYMRFVALFSLFSLFRLSLPTRM